MDHQGPQVDLFCLSARPALEITAQLCICRKVAITSPKSCSTGVKKRKVAACIRDEVLEALLAGCKVGNLQGRRSLLTTAIHILEDESPPYLRAEMAHQQSNLSRLAANLDHTKRFIVDFCCRYKDHSDKCIPRFYHQFELDRLSKRLNALYGRPHGSHLENLVQCDK